jgi:hypothetical protein
MALHPYRGLPPAQFWTTATSAAAEGAFDLAQPAKLTIGPADKVATAGSCFAQHIARTLAASGYSYLQTEPPAVAGEPAFSARYGNIYTPRQLGQLMAEAFGLRTPRTRAWRRPDGRFIDPLRPQLFPEGFATAEDVVNARLFHLLAVRRLLQECQVFVFTLGLTEAWLAADGTCLPVPPGALETDDPAGEARFHNFTAAELSRDMDQFVRDLKAINPTARVVLTVSPVPMVATYEQRNVIVSNSYSKAALRVTAEDMQRAHAHVAYFPAYEIITAPQAGNRYFEADLRQVTAEGVDLVMRLFAQHIMQRDGGAEVVVAPVRVAKPSAAVRQGFEAKAAVLCDDEVLEKRERRVSQV